MVRCKTRKTFTSTRGRTGEYSSPGAHVRQGSWGNVCVTRCMSEYGREHSCVRCTAGNIVSTAVGIIHYWEGTPHRVLISVISYSNNKKSSKKILVSRIFLSQKNPRLGVFELSFLSDTLASDIFGRNLFFPNILFGPPTQIIIEKSPRKKAVSYEDFFSRIIWVGGVKTFLKKKRY